MEAKGSGDPFNGVPDTPQTSVVDPDGNAYLAGCTTSSNFPTTPGAFQTSPALNTNDFAGFVTKLDSSGSTLGYSTHFGVNVLPSGLAVDTSRQAHVSARFGSEVIPHAALHCISPQQKQKLEPYAENS